MLERHKFTRCNLKNTGIRISNLSKEEMKRYRDHIFDKKYIQEQFKNGKFDGCYINGMLIKSKEEIKQIADNKRVEYQQFKEQIIKNTLSDIDDQIKGMKK